jgi:hypothetical protein
MAPSERKLHQWLDHMWFPNLRGKWYSNTYFSQVKSLWGNIAGQMLTNRLGFDLPIGLRDKKSAHEGLTSFIQQVGIPQTLVTDNTKEETTGEWGSICWKYHIRQEQTLPFSQWRNLTEHSIREPKVGMHRATLNDRTRPSKAGVTALSGSQQSDN